MGSSSPLILEISSDEEFDLGDIRRGSDGGGGEDFGPGDCFDWLSEFFGDVGGDKNAVENENDASDDVVMVSEVTPNKIKKLGFVGSKPVDKETMDHKIDVGEEDDDDDDCVILDCDPANPVAVVMANVDNRDCVDNVDDDVEIVGEKGEVACRDFPHPRHLCAKFPFASTSHEAHCAQCHCYVCDSLAPCSLWGTGKSIHDHCHATDTFQHWKTERRNTKRGKSPTPSLPQPVGPDHLTRPAIIRPCSWRSVNFNVATTSVFGQLTSNSSRCVMQQNSHSTSAASRSQRPNNIGSFSASSLAPRAGFKRPGESGNFPSSSKRANTSQISGIVSANAYKIPPIRLIRGAHGSNGPNAPVNNISSPHQLITPQPLLGDSRKIRAPTASESFITTSQFLQGSSPQPVVDRSFRNMNVAPPIPQFTSGYTSMGHQNGVGFSQNFSIGSGSLHIQIPEPERALPGDDLQYNSAVKEGNFQQQNVGSVDGSLPPEGTKQDSLDSDLSGWLLGHSSSEEQFSVPLSSPVWSMFSPEPASLCTEIPFDY